MKIFSLKTCDTCREAIKALGASGADLIVVDVRSQGVSRSDLVRFHTEFGDALINRQSTTWRGLSQNERARDPVELLADHPTLMKRPVIEANGQLYLGWKADVQNALLG